MFGITILTLEKLMAKETKLKKKGGRTKKEAEAALRKALQEFLNKKYRNGFTKNTISGFYGVLSGALRMAVYPY
jgi:hypothetical protein